MLYNYVVKKRKLFTLKKYIITEGEDSYESKNKIISISFGTYVELYKLCNTFRSSFGGVDGAVTGALIDSGYY